MYANGFPQPGPCDDGNQIEELHGENLSRCVNDCYGYLKTPEDELLELQTRNALLDDSLFSSSASCFSVFLDDVDVNDSLTIRHSLARGEIAIGPMQLLSTDVVEVPQAADAITSDDTSAATVFRWVPASLSAADAFPAIVETLNPEFIDSMYQFLGPGSMDQLDTSTPNDCPEYAEERSPADLSTDSEVAADALDDLAFDFDLDNYLNDSSSFTSSMNASDEFRSDHYNPPSVEQEGTVDSSTLAGEWQHDDASVVVHRAKSPDNFFMSMSHTDSYLARLLLRVSLLAILRNHASKRAMS